MCGLERVMYLVSTSHEQMTHVCIAIDYPEGFAVSLQGI